MKGRIAILILSCVIFTGSFAQESPKDYSNMTKPGVMFCGMQKGNRLVVVQENKVITKDVILDNGLTVKRDGSVLKNKEKMFKLKDGDCINSNGDMVTTSAEEREIKSNASPEKDKSQ